jgi:hypothetical protein
MLASGVYARDNIEASRKKIQLLLIYVVDWTTLRERGVPRMRNNPRDRHPRKEVGYSTRVSSGALGRKCPAAYRS